MARVGRRLAEQDILRADLSADDAADVLWMLTSFESFDLLYAARQLSLDRTVDLIVATAERTLYR